MRLLPYRGIEPPEPDPTETAIFEADSIAEIEAIVGKRKAVSASAQLEFEAHDVSDEPRDEKGQWAKASDAKASDIKVGDYMKSAGMTVPMEVTKIEPVKVTGIEHPEQRRERQLESFRRFNEPDRIPPPPPPILDYLKFHFTGSGYTEVTLPRESPVEIHRKLTASAHDVSDEPRDASGKWTKDGGSTDDVQTFPGSVEQPNPKLLAGKEDYAESHGLGTPAAKDWAGITADPERGHRIASDYDKLPMFDESAKPAYDALRSEVHEQFQYMTTKLGIKVDVVDHDPYANVQELAADLRDNNHISVLSTAATGSHPYLSNQENDEFRAVHDVFGHASIGRGFDRNGEEAAFQSHAQMFTPLATRALATETRGQNSELIFGTHAGEFPPQKLALLPEIDALVAALLALMAAASGQPNADEDNRYELTNCHHTSLGRRLMPTTAAAHDVSGEARDERGRWTSSADGTTGSTPEGEVGRTALIEMLTSNLGIPNDIGNVGLDERRLAKADIVAAAGRDIADAVRTDPAVRAEYEAYKTDGRQNDDTDQAKAFRLISAMVGAKEMDAQEGLDIMGKGKEGMLEWYRSTLDYKEEMTSDIDRYGRFKAQQYVDSWAATSSGTNLVSLGLQRATADVLGASSSSFEKYVNSLNSLPSGRPGEPAWASLDRFNKEEGATARAFVQGEYDRTQAALERRGITEVTIERGFQGAIPLGNDVPIDMNPASSWTVSEEIAKQFARSDGGVATLLRMTVPAEDIISTSRTGRGALHEGEVLVRNQPGARTQAIVASGGALFYVDGPDDADWIKKVSVTAAAHDVSDEPRDDHGRWSTNGGDTPIDGGRWTSTGEHVTEEEYRGQHQPNSEGPPVYDLLQGDIMPKDVYEHPEYFTGYTEKNFISETLSTLRTARGNPDAEITIYRASPEKGQINNGDWVTLSRSYAEQHAMYGNPDGTGTDWPVTAMKVTAKDVKFAGDDLMEWGYWGPSKNLTAAGPPDEERDSRGRWTSGGGGSTDSSLDHRVWKGGPVDYEKDLETAKAGLAQALGTTVDQLDEQQIEFVKSMHEPEPDAREYRATIGEKTYAVRFRDHENLPIEGVHQALDTLQSLAEARPFYVEGGLVSKDKEIFIQFDKGGGDDEPGTLATTMRGFGTMYINDDQVQHYDRTNRESPGYRKGWFPDSLDGYPQLTTTLAHEWGHAIDDRNNHEAIADNLVLGTPSVYGAQGGERESFAEAFSEYYLNGDTSSAVARAYGKEYGWPTK